MSKHSTKHGKIETRQARQAHKIEYNSIEDTVILLHVQNFTKKIF